MARRALITNILGLNGDTESGGLVNSFVRGTSTRTPLYAGLSGGSTLLNPAVADGLGQITAYLDDAVEYSLRATTADASVNLWEADVVAGVLTITFVNPDYDVFPLSDVSWSGILAAPFKGVQSVNTYADLTALTQVSGLIDGAVYQTKCRATSDDGGEGRWRYDAASTATANGGTILAIDGGGAGRFFRLFDGINFGAAWFGYVADDATDNTAALLAAATAAASKVLNIPAGAGRHGEIILPAALTIRGVGVDQTILKRKSGSNNYAFTCNSLTGFAFEDMTIDGNVAQNASSGSHGGINCQTCTRPRFRNLKLKDWRGTFMGANVGGGIAYSGGSGALEENVETTGCWDGVLAITHPNRISRKGKTTADYRWGQLSDNASHNTTIEDFEISGTGLITSDACGGIYAQDSRVYSVRPRGTLGAFGNYGCQHAKAGASGSRVENADISGAIVDAVGVTSVLGAVTDFVCSGSVLTGSIWDNIALADGGDRGTIRNVRSSGGALGIAVFRQSNTRIKDCSGDVNIHDATRVTSATVASGGSGGANGTNVPLTVTSGTWLADPTGNSAPVLLGTISGGALTAITGIQYAGNAKVPLPSNPVNVSGGGLTGATVNLTYLGANSGTCNGTVITGHRGGNLYVQPGCTTTGVRLIDCAFDSITDLGHQIDPGYNENGPRLLFSLLADMNTTADQAWTKHGNFGDWTPLAYRIVDASISLTTAAGGLYSAASKGGDQLVPSSTIYTTLTGPTVGMNIGFSALGVGRRTEDVIYLSLGTPQGAAATAFHTIWGYRLS